MSRVSDKTAGCWDVLKVVGGACNRKLLCTKSHGSLKFKRPRDLKLEVAMEKCTEGVEALAQSQYHPAYKPATKEEEISGQIGLATRTITEENSCHFTQPCTR